MTTSKAIQELIKFLFPQETARRKEGRCPFCGKEIDHTEFRDQISQQEFQISGLCQNCQDDFFESGT